MSSVAYQVLGISVPLHRAQGTSASYATGLYRFCHLSSAAHVQGEGLSWDKVYGVGSGHAVDIVHQILGTSF